MQENNYNNDHNGNMSNRDLENFNHRSNRELLALVTLIDERTREIEKTIKELSTAYIKNDLGAPDYDGHRKSHIQMDKQADIMDNYKKSVTETVMTWVVTGLLILITSAAIESIRHYILASNT
jgi:hypothetical protein